MPTETLLPHQVHSETPAPVRKHMPGLDVVRGFAILAVVLYHGLAPFGTRMQSRLTPLQFHFLNCFHVASLGVHLFFVLSGFLISGILLDTRHNQEFFGPFYKKRMLRIYPVYFASVAFLKLVGAISWRFVAVCLLHICNMSNLLHAAPEYSTFWSLSVEEQYYLVWPVVVRKCSPRTLFLISSAILVLSPVLRSLLLFGPAALQDIHYKTWDVGDFFAGGAIMAIVIRSSRLRHFARRLALGCIAAGGTLIVFAASLPVLTGIPGKIQRGLYYSPWAILFSGIVLLAYDFPAIASLRIMRPIIFLGYISYGLYVIDPYIYTKVDRWWPIELGVMAHGALFGAMICRLVFETGIAILVAYISRRTFEQYFLNRKPRQRRVVEDLKIA